MMLADPEDIQAQLVGQLDFFHEIAEPLLWSDRRFPGAGLQLRECVDAEFHVDFLSPPRG